MPVPDSGVARLGRETGSPGRLGVRFSSMDEGAQAGHLLLQCGDALRGVLRAPLRASDLMGPKVASKLPSREEILKGKF